MASSANLSRRETAAPRDSPVVRHSGPPDATVPTRRSFRAWNRSSKSARYASNECRRQSVRHCWPPLTSGPRRFECSESDSGDRKRSVCRSRTIQKSSSLGLGSPQCAVACAPWRGGARQVWRTKPLRAGPTPPPLDVHSFIRSPGFGRRTDAVRAIA